MAIGCEQVSSACAFQVLSGLHGLLPRATWMVFASDPVTTKLNSVTFSCIAARLQTSSFKLQASSLVWEACFESVTILIDRSK
jgi:hypothetical protein